MSDADILLFGGTGHLGREVIQLLLRAGRSVRVASRRPRPSGLPASMDWARADLVSGRGIERSVRGIDTIIFCATDAKNHAAVEVDGMRRLLHAARRERVSHLVYASSAGADNPRGFSQRTKWRAESLIRESGAPYTILRTTQFHSSLASLFSRLANVPIVMPVPLGLNAQPLATEDVAARLVRCANEEPRETLPNFCGPEILSLCDAAEMWKQARGLRKPIAPILFPGVAAAALRNGCNVVAAGERGTTRFSQWLDRKFGSVEVERLWPAPFLATAHAAAC